MRRSPDHIEVVETSERDVDAEYRSTRRFADQRLGIVCFFGLKYRSFLHLDGTISGLPERSDLDAHYSKGRPWGS